MATKENVPGPGASKDPATAGIDYTRPLVVVTSLFFMWGFLTCLNDILVPHLKSIFNLSYTKAMLVQFAFFSAYFLFSLPWSKVVNAIGYQQTMVAGLLTMACGAFLFVPAATTVSYPLFLVALLVLATGITGLQVSANPYVDLLGKPETASSRLDLTQAFNSLGTTIAPKIGGLLILGAAAPLVLDELHKLSGEALQAYRIQQAATVKVPYATISVVLIALAVVIKMFKLPKIGTSDPGSHTTNDSIWNHRNLILGAVGIFAYVGAEVSIGSFLVNYFGLPEIAGLPAKVAAGFVSFFWAAVMIGRFLGAGVLERLKPNKVLAMCAVAASLLVCASMLTSGRTAMWSILAVGLFNSIMFPTIFSLGVAELGPLTSSASGVLNMAIVGGAIIPVAQGVIADRVGIHHAFILPIFCYLYILFYGLNGFKPNSVRFADQTAPI